MGSSSNFKGGGGGGIEVWLRAVPPKELETIEKLKVWSKKGAFAKHHCCVSSNFKSEYVENRQAGNPVANEAGSETKQAVPLFTA